ncbi:MAG: hypothetical protein WD669_01535 [Pirellulales bacterium]
MATAVADSRRAKRRWLGLRFGLRTFLVAFAVLSVVLGLFSRELVRVRRQRAITHRLANGGAYVSYDYQVDRNSIRSGPGAANLLRRLFGDDLFANVVYAKWDYTYRAIAGSDIELLLQTPTVANVEFIGPESASGRPPQTSKSDAAIAEDLESQAASFGLLAQCKNLRQLSLYGGFATDSHLKALRGGGSLRSLHLLCSPSVSDEGAIAIASFKNLEWLDICEAPQVADASVAELMQLAGLKSLDLSGTAITDGALTRLGNLCNLERLVLDKCRITDHSLSELPKLTKLKILQLSHTQISDIGLNSLSTLSELQELDVSGTQITDAGMYLLSRLAGLVTLKLCQTQVTDAGLMKLKALPSLRHVNVTVGKSVSLDGVRRLKPYLPRCLFECTSYNLTTGATILEEWE